MFERHAAAFLRETLPPALAERLRKKKELKLAAVEVATEGNRCTIVTLFPWPVTLPGARNGGACRAAAARSTQMPDEQRSDGTSPPVTGGTPSLTESGRSPYDIGRCLAEERVSWDHRDPMIERCPEEAQAARLRAAGEVVDGSETAAGPRADPDVPGRTVLRTIGRRTTPPAGVLRAPTPEEQEWVRRMSACRTRVPKGVFRYASAAEANADWDRWRAEALAEGAGVERSRQGR